VPGPNETGDSNYPKKGKKEKEEEEGKEKRRRRERKKKEGNVLGLPQHF